MRPGPRREISQPRCRDFCHQADGNTGDLRRLRWHEPPVDIIGDPRLAENFRVLLPRSDYEAAYFNSRDQTVKTIEHDATGITCAYERYRRRTSRCQCALPHRFPRWRPRVQHLCRQPDGPAVGTRSTSVCSAACRVSAADRIQDRSSLGVTTISRRTSSTTSRLANTAAKPGSAYSACGFVYPAMPGSRCVVRPVQRPHRRRAVLRPPRLGGAPIRCLPRDRTRRRPRRPETGRATPICRQTSPAESQWAGSTFHMLGAHQLTLDRYVSRCMMAIGAPGAASIAAGSTDTSRSRPKAGCAMNRHGRSTILLNPEDVVVHRLTIWARWPPTRADTTSRFSRSAAGTWAVSIAAIPITGPTHAWIAR